MVTVEKNGVKMTAKDENQLAAFLNNGWKKVETEKSGSATSGTGKSQSKTEK